MTTISFPSDFEHHAASLSEIALQVHGLGATRAILKILPKNANDKNQVYLASSFSALYNNFSLTLTDRGMSSSLTKTASKPGSHIPEAVFKDFAWVRRDGSMVKARNVKAIVYTQYPEARLSGFQTVENTMPQSLSVTYVKANPDSQRLLVMACMPGGACLAMVYLGIPATLAAEIAALPGLEGSKVCKLLTVEQNYSEMLFGQLKKIVARPMKGCRMNAFGMTLPFTGTQVCGYTLEHALGIVPNSAKDGDIYGIELKTHTQVKVTLFTPEPDFGPYAESFDGFMHKYGSLVGDALRVTGVHRAGVRCSGTGLTLKVREYRVAPSPAGMKPDWIRDASGEKQAYPYNPATSLTSKMDAVEVVLEDDEGQVAAGWSLERLMNNWGVKHNEVIYVSASKARNTDPVESAAGFAYKVTFASKVIWCRGTSAERLLKAIADGVIFLDPAPKLVPGDAGQTKRRSQWRVNDISSAINALYEKVESRVL